MNMKYYYIFQICVIGMLVSCQPRTAVKTEQKALPDSALYYQQADISDPFLDTIFQEPDQSIALNQTIYPAVVPEIKPKFREVEGFRVQVFAGSDSIQAFSIRDLVSLQTEDSVHYILEKGLCKIQIGDYLYRYQADNMKTTMRQNGYPGAWVVQRNIIVPIDSSMADSVAIDQPNQQDSAIVAGKYKIQLVATGSLEKAEEIVNNVRTLTNHHVYHEQSGNLFKVLVGSFEEESQARSELEKLRNLGYPDAWLVY